MSVFLKSTTVFIQGLDSSITENEIRYEIFAGLDISKVELFFDAAGRFTGSVSVVFPSEAQAKKVQAEYDNAQVDGRPMTVSLLAKPVIPKVIVKASQAPKQKAAAPKQKAAAPKKAAAVAAPKKATSRSKKATTPARPRGAAKPVVAPRRAATAATRAVPRARNRKAAAPAAAPAKSPKKVAQPNTTRAQVSKKNAVAQPKKNAAAQPKKAARSQKSPQLPAKKTPAKKATPKSAAQLDADLDKYNARRPAQ